MINHRIILKNKKELIDKFLKFLCHKDGGFNCLLTLQSTYVKRSYSPLAYTNVKFNFWSSSDIKRSLLKIPNHQLLRIFKKHNYDYEQP